MQKQKDVYSQEIYDGFEDGLSDVWSTRLLAPHAVEIQSLIVRSGKNALKITVQTGDIFSPAGKNYNASERAEVVEKEQYWVKEEESHEYSFSIFIPQDFPIVPTRLVLAQWKQYADHANVSIDNPVLALRYVGGKLYITLQTTEKKNKIWTMKEDVKGMWLDFIFQMKFTRLTEGFLNIWINKKQIVEYIGTTAYSEQYEYQKHGRFYFKMGLYRDTMNEPMTAYFDEFRKRSIPR